MQPFQLITNIITTKFSSEIQKGFPLKKWITRLLIARQLLIMARAALQVTFTVILQLFAHYEAKINCILINKLTQDIVINLKSA